MKVWFLRLLFVLFLAAVFECDLTHSRADEKTIDFVEAVAPILRTKCISCHGAEKQEGNLRLDSLEAARRGGATGSALVPRDLAKSLLVEAVRFTNPDLQMPPKQKLADREIETLVRWIEAGANWPASATLIDDSPANPPEGRGSIGDAFTDPNNPIRRLFGGQRLDLWSLKRPVVKSVDGHDKPGSTNVESLSPKMIDYFIRKRLADAGLVSSLEADRRTLIRRLSFDLTGLPPTPKEVQTFLEDKSTTAFESLVGRMLDSPRYGERWARHWLDVVRYADTEGFERDEFRPLMWQFRDYVIRSFNQDKPFDQFIREQLAGDEIFEGPPANSSEADMLIATGFLRLGQWDSTAAIFQEEVRHRDQQMADLANTTGSAFLGLTFSCCQCHDHKYDPLSQADHFRLRAFFAGLQPRNDLVIELPDELQAITSHNEMIDKEAEPIRAEQAKLDKDKPEERPRFDELGAKIAEVESKKRSPKMAIGATDSTANVPTTHVFYQGDFSQPREEVEPGFVSVFYPGSAPIASPRAEVLGRRLALANWIASTENPWTARVLVNRVWQHHFGVGLVATSGDFGFSGSRPTHPELLDWLAVAFMNEGWSIKKLHKAIVCSSTYRQRSDGMTAERDPAGNRLRVQRDPGNALLWRQNVIRLDAETIRDSLLAVSSAMRSYEQGKPLWPHVPLDLLHAQPGILEAKDNGDGGRMQGWYEDPVQETDVRSIFLVRKRSMPIPFLQAFDLPDSTISCARRDTTVVAPQALMLLNSPESARYAQLLAEQIVKAVDRDQKRQTTLLFQLALSRLPDADELVNCLELLRKHTKQYQSDNAADQAGLLAMRDLCRVVLNLNEFVYID